jgi:hypothetical protein
MELRSCLLGRGRIFVQTFASFFLIFGLLLSGPVFANGIFVNEFHYDNAGTDVDEGIEIAGPAGTDLLGWSLLLYNGNNGSVYNSLALLGTIPDQQHGFGTLSFARNGLQNGSPDGFALLDPDSVVVQFLSYEGTLQASGGAASGMTSVDIGKAEPSSSPVGFSLQLAGFGSLYENFSWTEASLNSFGVINAGQSFVAQPPIPAPEPATFVLFGVAAMALLLLRKRLKN